MVSSWRSPSLASFGGVFGLPEAPFKSRINTRLGKRSRGD